jgi:hypothetical protein
MQRLANTFTRFDDADELSNDRLPGMPLVGFLTGTAVSLAMWGAVAALLAWSV